MQGMIGVLAINVGIPGNCRIALEVARICQKMRLRKRPNYGECLQSSDDVWKLFDGEDISFGCFDTSSGLDLRWILLDSMC